MFSPFSSYTPKTAITYYKLLQESGAVCGNPMTRKTTQDNDIPCFRAAHLRTITRRFMKFLGYLYFAKINMKAID